jgi:hypothetical protein
MVEVIGAAFEKCGEVQYLLSGSGELTRCRGLTQHAGKFAVMLGAGHARPHHRP